MNNDYNQNDDFNNNYGNYGNDNFNQNQMNGNFNNGGDFGQDDGYVVYEDDKKEKTKKILIIVLLVLIILIILFLLIKGCQGGGSNSGDTTINADVESPIYMGETGKIRIKSNNRGMNYSLEMDDEDIAELEDEEISGSNAKTEIIPKRDGKTTLTITPSDDKKKFDSLERNVVICKRFNEKALVTTKNINIKRGDSMALTFDLGVEGECYSNLTYKPADNSIISINSNGMITGEKAGNTTLTVSNGTDSVKVNVKVTTTGTTTQSVSNPSGTSSASIPKATSVTISSNNKVNKAYAKAGDTVTVSMTFNKTLSQKPVVMINSRAASVGNGTNKFKASVKITSNDPDKKVDLLIYNYKANGLYGNQIDKASNSVVVDNSKPTCTLGKSGAKLTLTGKDKTGIVGYAIDQVPQSTSGFTSTRTRNATAAGAWYGHVMDKAGNIGHCQTSVSSSDIAGASGTNIAVTDLSLSTSSKSITVGNKTTISFTITPSNASNKALSWSSSDEKVAIVNQSGEVTGMGAGQAIIKATSKADSSVFETITITVTKPSVVVDPQPGSEPDQPDPGQSEEQKDTEAPTCTVKLTRTTTNESYTEKWWTKQSVRINASCKDNKGMKSVQLKFKNSVEASGIDNAVYTRTLNDGLWSKEAVNLVALDTAGNKYSDNIDIYIDRSNPYISSSGPLKSDNSVAGKLTFSANVYESGSGIVTAKWYYKKKTDDTCSAGTAKSETQEFNPTKTGSAIAMKYTATGLTKGSKYCYYAVFCDNATNCYNFKNEHKTNGNNGWLTSYAVK